MLPTICTVTTAPSPGFLNKSAILGFRLGGDWRLRRADPDRWGEENPIAVVSQAESKNEPTGRLRAPSLRSRYASRL